MKQIILVLACMFAFSAANAQKNSGGTVEFSFGSSQFTNYSAVSAFSDATPEYGKLLSLSFTGGYRFYNNIFIGGKLFREEGNTSAIFAHESFENLGLMLDVRLYTPISEKFEIEYGLVGGALSHGNYMKDAADKKYALTRWGIYGYVAVGLRYSFTSVSYVGIKFNLPSYGLLLGDKPEIPASFTAISSANEQDRFSNYSINFALGFRF